MYHLLKPCLPFFPLLNPHWIILVWVCQSVRTSTGIISLSQISIQALLWRKLIPHKRQQIKTWMVLHMSSTPEPIQILMLHQGNMKSMLFLLNLSLSLCLSNKLLGQRKREESLASQTRSYRLLPSIRGAFFPISVVAVCALYFHQAWQELCSQMQHLGIFWSDPAKPNGSESLGNSHWLEELPAALHCLYYQLWTTFMELLKVSTGTTVSFFGNFIVRQPAFWVCCSHCSPLMLLTLFLARLVSPRPAQRERMKSLTLFHALFLLVCFISQEWRWGNYTFQ